MGHAGCNVCDAESQTAHLCESYGANLHLSGVKSNSTGDTTWQEGWQGGYPFGGTQCYTTVS